MNGEARYRGVATFGNGRTVEMEGTLPQCSNWADNLIRCEGDCQIVVDRMDTEGNDGGYADGHPKENVPDC